MKVGDLVKICRGFVDVGLYLWADPEFVSRSIVLMHGDQCSIPTFQLEVISEGR